MKILFIANSFPNSYNCHSGIFFLDQAAALAKRGNDVKLISAKPVSIRNIIKSKKIDFGLKRSIKNGVSFCGYQFPAPPKVRRVVLFLRSLLLKKILNNIIAEGWKPDIIHVHVYESGRPALYAKKKYGIPFVVTEHSSGFALNSLHSSHKQLAKSVFRESSQNIAVSRSLRNLLQEEFSREFEFIPNIVDTDFFKCESKSKNKNQTIFLNVGNLTRNKNQSSLIKAFYEIYGNDKKYKLIIAGNGPERKNLEKLINKLGLSKQVELKGRIDRQTVKELMCSADCFVLTSKYETFGVVLIEAMSCGCPVIATKCGGPESIILSNKHGIICKNSYEGIKKALAEFVKNNFTSACLRTFVVENYSDIVVSNKLVGIYTNII